MCSTSRVIGWHHWTRSCSCRSSRLWSVQVAECNGMCFKRMLTAPEITESAASECGIQQQQSVLRSLSRCNGRDFRAICKRFQITMLPQCVLINGQTLEEIQSPEALAVSTAPEGDEVLYCSHHDRTDGIAFQRICLLVYWTAAWPPRCKAFVRRTVLRFSPQRMRLWCKQDKTRQISLKPAACSRQRIGS